MKPAVDNPLPLSPPILHILLALSSSDLHGYGIMLTVAKQSGGEYKIGPGTLYDNIKKLLSLKWIDESMEGDGEDSARRVYHLNEKGRAVLVAETERLAQVLREARRCLKLNPGRPA
jgi:DNA-binding PadR family transcriptional regulator